MRLSTLVLFNLDLKMLNLHFMFNFSFVEFLDVINIELLLLSTAHLLPDTEALVDQLLVKRVGATQNKLLCQFVSFNV